MAKNKSTTIEDYNLEQIRKISVVEATHNNVQISVRDLREILFRYHPAQTVRIGNHFLYSVLIGLGVQVKGFRPNKTKLRHTYGLSIDEINKILPGSYTSLEGDGRRKGNPKK